MLTGPFFHGTRRAYNVGDLLLTDVVNNQPGEEDARLMCFASTSEEDALHWAYQRGIGKGLILYVFEVDMADPQVDVNMYPQRMPIDLTQVTSVMSHEGRVLRLAREIPIAEYDDAWFGKY